MAITFTTSLTLFFLLLYFSLHLHAYTPEEIFTISCGTTGKSSDGQRRWTGDEDTKYLSFKDGSVSEKATTQSPSTNQIPYSTARLSRSQFNYSFPVSPGPKFLRLFFYPSDYPNFPRNQASFTLQSNQFTLLNAFNASLNADAQATTTIFREYVVNVNDGERLILTFTPSHPNSYAFINGIEVLSMPTDLYYTPPNDTGVKLVEHGTLFNVLTSFALQTEYRIKSGAKKSRHKTTPMNITVNPDYVAPKELFRTARSQSRNGTLNKISYLTWVFPVDCGFTYVLRLHFCELEPHIHDIADRQFFIYIKSQLAEERADVMKWSKKQKGLAVHRNYAVMIPKNGNQKRFNLSLQMHPYESGVDTTYSDAFLNGLEIFKISEAGSNNLAGPNPDTVQTNGLAGPIPDPINNRRRMIVITAGVVSETEQVSLASWARYCYQNGTVAEIVDPILKGKIAPQCFAMFCEIGISCLSQEGMQRPSMNDVVLMLESALKLQESADESEEGVREDVIDTEEHHNNSKDNDKLMLELFSEIVDPKPR
ncbi:hypothetical protein ACSQ67_008413 [Phaseolus vulgaris]